MAIIEKININDGQGEAARKVFDNDNRISEQAVAAENQAKNAITIANEAKTAAGNAKLLADKAQEALDQGLPKKADTTNAQGTLVRTADGKIPEADLNVYTVGELVDRLTSGKYTNAHNGLSYTSPDYHSSEFIKVTPGQKLSITGTFGYNPTDTTMIAGVAGYSSDNESTFVSPVFSPEMAGANKQGRYTVEDFEVTVPTGVNYIKGSSVFATKELSIKDATTESVKTVVPRLQQEVDTLNENSFITKNIPIVQADIESGSINTTGGYLADNTRLRTKNYDTVEIFEVTNINTGYEYRIIGWKNGVYVGMADWSSAKKTWNVISNLGFTEIKLVFRKTANTALTVTEFPNIGFTSQSNQSLKSYVVNGGGTITADVILRNKESEKAVMAVRKGFSAWTTSTEIDIPFFAHTSDIHGDTRRLANFVKYCEYIGVDAAFVTGDIVVQYYNDDFSFYKNAALASTVKMFHVLGNHENERATSDTDVMQHTRFFADLDTKMGMIHDNKCYYYRDFAAKKTRVVGLNQFQLGGSVRENRYLKDDQIAWFINTLKSTPQGYGIILLTHIPEHAWSVDNNYNKFWQKTLFFNDLMTNTTGSPIADIIDSFISRTTISKSYTQNGALSTLNVSADFSTGVNSGVEFIAYMNGHLHADRVGYLNNTVKKQLVLNILMGNAFTGTYRDALGDMPRMSGTVAEDAFNVYGIDRALGSVKIARVGSNMNYMMEKRDFLVIPYK